MIPRREGRPIFTGSTYSIFAETAPGVISVAVPGRVRNSAPDKINFLIATYTRLLSGLFKLSVWSPLLILALFQALGLLLLSNFFVGGLRQVLYPFLSLFLPEALLHYPQYYLALPSLYSGYNTLILGPTVWVLISASAVYKLGGYYRGAKLSLSEGLRESVRLYIPLLLFWVIETVMIFVVLFSLNVAFREYVAGSPRTRLLFEYGYQLIAYCFSAFLIYSIPGIVISGRRLGGAIKHSIGLCRKNFFLTFIIIAVPGTVGALIDIFVSGFSPQLVSLFSPESITLILYIRISLGILINLLVYGSAVFLYSEMDENK